MPEIKINGQPVQVGEEFFRLTPEQQDATVDEIARELGAAGAQSGLQSGEWGKPGVLAPIQFQKGTGAWRLAMPLMVSGLLDAAQAPGRALQGEYDERTIDPVTGQVSLFDPRMVEDAQTLGSAITPGAALPRVLGPADNLAIAATRQAGELGIPLSRGQASGKLNALQREETMRQSGGPAQDVMRKFDAQQEGAIDTAATGIGAQFGNAANMPERVSGALRDKVATSKQRASSLYNIAEEGGAAVNVSAVDGLPRVVNTMLDDQGVLISKESSPQAADAYKQVLDFVNGAKQGKSAGVLNAADADPTAAFGVSLKGIENLRRRIGTYSGANDFDRMALKSIRQGLDEWLDDAVDKALFSGDESALAALKQARQESRFYLGLTKPKSGDTAGKRLAQMQADDVTAREVGNWLYGADIVSPSLEAPKVAGRLKLYLGPASPEFSAIRAAAWERLVRDLSTGDMKSAHMVAKRIDEFTNGKGAGLARVLFDKEHLGQMRMFSSLLKRVTPPKDATNPSRTAWALGPIMQNIMTLVAGGAAGSVAGVPGVMAAMSLPVLRNVKNIAGAKKATRGITPREQALPGQLTPEFPAIGKPLGETLLDRPAAPPSNVLFRLEA